MCNWSSQPSFCQKVFIETWHKITRKLQDSFTFIYSIYLPHRMFSLRQKNQTVYPIAITSREHVIQLQLQPRTFGIDSVRQVIAALRRRLHAREHRARIPFASPPPTVNARHHKHVFLSGNAGWATAGSWLIASGIFMCFFHITDMQQKCVTEQRNTPLNRGFSSKMFLFKKTLLNI